MGGNSFTTLVATVHAFDINNEETCSTLMFASSCRQVSQVLQPLSLWVLLQPPPLCIATTVSLGASVAAAAASILVASFAATSPWQPLCSLRTSTATPCLLSLSLFASHCCVSLFPTTGKSHPSAWQISPICMPICCTPDSAHSPDIQPAQLAGACGQLPGSTW